MEPPEDAPVTGRTLAKPVAENVLVGVIQAELDG